MEEKYIDQRQEIWSAIRYLDPDENDKSGDIATIVTGAALLLAILVVWVLLCVRGL
jgi:hypothetical protein